VSLVNNAAGCMVCPERLVQRTDAPWMAEHLVRLLTDRQAAERCRQDIRAAVESFGGPGASKRAARAAAALLEG
jgi:lipid A disaccharide synthetase